MNLILASGSPRRRELLTMLGARFSVIPARGEERADPALAPPQLVEQLALAKAREVARLHPDAVVIGADTVVSADGAVLGKPHSQEEAAAMLRSLSGRAHSVFTGLAVLSPAGEQTGWEETRVHFRPLSEREIAAYIATGEPLDKAGAYGAQGIASLFVERIEGDFFNVVGLPLCRLGKMLKMVGVRLL